MEPSVGCSEMPSEAIVVGVAWRWLVCLEVVPFPDALPRILRLAVRPTRVSPSPTTMHHELNYSVVHFFSLCTTTGNPECANRRVSISVILTDFDGRGRY